MKKQNNHDHFSKSNNINSSGYITLIKPNQSRTKKPSQTETSLGWFLFIFVRLLNLLPMYKTLLTFTLLFVSTFTQFAQEKIKGNKNVTIIETEVESFNKIVISEDFKINLKKGDYESVEIETDENLHDVIKINVVDSVLSLKKTKRIISSKKMNITVRYTNALKHLVLEDDAEVYSANTIENFNFNLKINDNAKAFLNLKTYSFKLVNNNDSKLKLSSKSKLNIESTLVDLELNEGSKTEALVTCDTLKIDMYQRASAKIEGDVKQINANTINSTDFTGKNLLVNNCNVITEDSSDFEIQVIDSITIESSGSSEIYLYGNPQITIKKFSDSVKLHKKEL